MTIAGDILRAAAERLDGGNAWIPGAYARDGQGAKCLAGSPEAAEFCAWGSYMAAAGGFGDEEYGAGVAIDVAGHTLSAAAMPQVAASDVAASVVAGHALIAAAMPQAAASGVGGRGTVMVERLSDTLVASKNWPVMASVFASAIAAADMDDGGEFLCDRVAAAEERAEANQERAIAAGNAG